MKKLLLLGLILLTACTNPTGSKIATPESTFTPQATATRISPTPLPATSTSTSTPAPTETPVPPERFFTEEFDTTPVYWSTLYASGDPSRVDVFSEGGSLAFDLSDPNTWLYAIYGPFEYDSVHIEAHVESRGSDVSAVGLVCNYDERDGWFEFNIYSDGTYNVLYGQWLADGIADHMPVLIDNSDRITTGIATDEIGLDCYENIVQLYINGKIIRKLDVERFGLTGGKVGLSLASFEESQVILAFDLVKVSEP